MMIGSIAIALTSPPDREYLVAELSRDDQQIAEINVESGQLSIELYARADGSPWSLPLLDLQAAIASAAALLDRRLKPE